MCVCVLGHTQVCVDTHKKCKDTSKQLEAQSSELKKILLDYIFDKGVVSKTYKGGLQLTYEKRSNIIKIFAKKMHINGISW